MLKITNIPEVSNPKNRGDRAEWNFCAYMGQTRCKHDAQRFDRASDVDAGDMKISVKSKRFTLFAGKIAHDNNVPDTMDAHIDFFFQNTHSNLFAYIHDNGACYLMDAHEFESFIRFACFMEAESSKNKGFMKVRRGRKVKEYERWLEARV